MENCEKLTKKQECFSTKYQINVGLQWFCFIRWFFAAMSLFSMVIHYFGSDFRTLSRNPP